MKVATAIILSDDILGNTPKGKIRVKLHKDVPNCGREGDVRFVSFQMYTNLLAPQKAAAKVRDADMTALVNARKTRWEKEQAEFKCCFEALNSYGTLSLQKSIGPNGQLFGSVTKKNAIQMIADIFPQYSSIINDQKSFQVDNFETQGEDGRKIIVADIRRGGIFLASISLPRYEIFPNTLELSIQVVDNQLSQHS